MRSNPSLLNVLAITRHNRNWRVNPFTPRDVLGTLNTLMQKAFQYFERVVSSTQEGKIGKYSSLYRGSSSWAGYQNYQQRKQTNVTSCVSWIGDCGYKWVKARGRRTYSTLLLLQLPPLVTSGLFFTSVQTVSAHWLADAAHPAFWIIILYSTLYLEGTGSNWRSEPFPP